MVNYLKAKENIVEWVTNSKKKNKAIISVCFCLQKTNTERNQNILSFLLCISLNVHSTICAHYIEFNHAELIFPSYLL